MWVENSRAAKVNKLALTEKAGGIIVNDNSKSDTEEREYWAENVYLLPNGPTNYRSALQSGRWNAP
jgi:hypothetical protein